MAQAALACTERLTPLILEHREETDSERRLAEPIVAELRRTGFARLALAEGCGGPALAPVETLRIYETLAAAEASVPWILWNCSLVMLFARYMQPELRAELFADPEALYAQCTRPLGTLSRTDGGYRLTGHWTLVSGCLHADWLSLKCFVHADGGPVLDASGAPLQRFACIAARDAEVIDTWHSGGLRGTGSHDVTVTDLHVPHHRTYLIGERNELDEPIARMPVHPQILAQFAAQTLGIAQCALDTVCAHARSAVTSGPLPDPRDRPATQAGVAYHGAALAAARAYLHECIDALWQRAHGDAAWTARDCGESYAAAQHASKVARETLDAMYDLGGSQALYTRSPLERGHRDLHAMLRHIVAQPMWLEDAGRVHFDLEPINPLYAV